MKVLFLGNSHTYFNDLAQIFKMLAEAGGKGPVEVGMLSQPGVPFGWHLSQEVELRYELMFGDYDYIVIQQGAHRPFPPAEDTLKHGKTIIEKARACGTEPILCMTWAEKRAPEHQQEMYDVLTKLAKDNDVVIEPSGYIFDYVNQNRPDIDLYFYDGEHCSAYGSYLRACCDYAVIFGESPVGLPAKSMCNALIDTELAEKTKPILQTPPEGDLDEYIASDYFQTAEDGMWDTYSMDWDKEHCYVDLDPEKAKALQELAWEYVQKYSKA